ncbi:MAG: glycoside hydrolase family 38 N-terminal domain-containing protein [Armatimonadota bacterium]
MPSGTAVDTRIFLVANSHIDPVWLWDKYEGIDEAINTFRAVCDLLDDYPTLKFSGSSIILYQWVEQYAADVFERIVQHVRSGRWEVVGGWLVESDCNLPTAASFLKTAEISHAFVADRFGIDVPVAYCPDSFGHAATLPALLADSGFKYYLFCRPGQHEKADLPSDLIYWAYQGKRVLCYRPKYHYMQGNAYAESFESALQDADYPVGKLAAYLFGMGDHGGGPTRMEVDYFLRKQEELTPGTLSFTTCREFFEAAEQLSDIPVYEGDLHFHAIGCYSVNRGIKHAVRTAERTLCYTERVQQAAGTAMPRELEPWWTKTLFNQFHDILPGSCAPDAARQTLDELSSVQSACADLSYLALKTLSAREPVQCPLGEFRIYNSLPEAVTAPFEVESFVYFRPHAAFKDAIGREIPMQEISPSVACGNHRWVFIDTIPANSVKAYYFDTTESFFWQQTAGFSSQEGRHATLDTARIEAPGQIFCDGTPLFHSPLSLGVIPDDSDTWSHGLVGYGQTKRYFTEYAASVCEGPLAAYLLSRQRYHHSQADLRFALYRGLPFVDLDITVRWEEERSLLKLEIALPESIDEVLAQCPGGTISKRTVGQEEPLHGWLLAGDIAVLQDGAFAFDRVGDTLRITLVRSCLYGYDKSWTLDPHGPQHHSDLGEHHFKFRFFRRAESPAALDRLFDAFIEPFKVIRENK